MGSEGVLGLTLETVLDVPATSGICPNANLAAPRYCSRRSSRFSFWFQIKKDGNLSVLD